ncbi:DoxX family protein [Priestia endophytica]|jgi:uncharacterized membrane protein YphA (DoxX/SURF4 family)|uniref:Oxidoreductase n=1 Tax=Priestia endophytica TaxID=135735 RepID=A0AAX1QCG5_9BACI|nr:DoxX family protein [Priestia endophytica]MCM3539541.1 DoxX family protein [Priestia endophytica]RAS79256.1 oxidoreductase [Priestia endophytica]RAS83930.1 oxidoreductase [Priestia endophytica]
MTGYRIGSALLRVFLGITFFIHGLQKFQGGIENTVAFFESVGFPGFSAYVVATIELVGGILMVLGVGTRIIAALFFFVLAGAILKVKLSAGFVGGYEVDLALLVIAVHLAIVKNTAFSLENLWAKKEK